MGEYWMPGNEHGCKSYLGSLECRKE